MRSRRRHSKRTADQWPEEEQVDDLAVAASFAAQAPVATTSNNNIEVPSCDDVPNAAEASSEDEDDSSESDGVQTNTVETCTDDAKEPSANDTTTTTAGGDDKEQEEDEQSSDEESEVDLAEALSRMQGDSDDEEGRSRRASRKAASSQERGQPPKTENEVDPYHMPVKELESKFNLSLTVQDRERLELVNQISRDDKTNVGDAPDSVQLCPAGHIKFHMVSDRTIVVESNITGSAPLDEGSLLVIKVENDKQSDDTHCADYESSRLRLVPLGKVFEVFGPVSRPLYTIRLPPPPEMPAKAVMDKKCHGDEKTHRPESEAKLTENSTSPDPEEKPKQIGTDVSEAKLTVGESGDTDESLKPDEGKADPSTDSTVEGTETAEAGKDVDGTEVLTEDPWSPNGRNTQILRSSPSMVVYFIQNEAKMIDTGAITQSSGRGCDASNLYDEEVINANEMEFSDDEQEREAKSRRKKGGKRDNRSDSARSTASSPANNAPRRRNRGGTRNQGHSPGYPLSVASTYYQAPQHYYPGMTYHQPQMPGAHAQAYPYQQPPTYFYQPTLPTAQPNVYQGPGYPQMQSVAGAGGVPPPPPPPPPPPRPYDSNAPAGFVSQGHGYPGQPEQEPDTVYYDYS